MPDRPVVTDEGPVRILRIQRPEVRNAIDSLSQQIAAFPRGCLVQDRRSVYEGLGNRLEKGPRRLKVKT